MLKEIEIRPACIIECNNFTVHYRVLRQLFERFGDERILPVEVLPSSGIQDDIAVRVDGNSAISIQLNLVKPIRIVGYFRNGEALHRFNESGFASGQRI